MARSPVLGSSGLSPFGNSGISFDAFNIAANVGEQAYLIFRRKEIEWEQGKLTDDAYLAALDGYAKALPEGSEKLNANVRYEETKYRVTRNKLVADIEDGDKEWEDLLAFDKARLNQIQLKDSTAYDEQLGRVREVQQRMFAEQEDIQREKYEDGKITSAQLTRWYEAQVAGDLTDDNPELEKTIAKRIDDLGDVVLQERDAKMVNDFNAGKVGYNAFLAYANAARGRYAKGTGQYDDWTERISDAKEQGQEQSLTYRYGLSQRYAQLQKFVKDHGAAPKGHWSTSTSTRKGTNRVIWDGNGWKTVNEGGGTTTKRKWVGPSASEQAAWQELQIEVKDAKKQMREIEAQMSRQPGGWVSTEQMIRYYGGVQRKYAKGSPEWYNVQERLDSLNQQRHAENVTRKQGVVISYPKVKTGGARTSGYTSGGGGGGGGGSSSASGGGGGGGSASVASGDRDITLDEFMRAVARVESGGRYDAVNKSSGARGKYQIMPSNWPGWAKKYLGDRNAAWTPENQEKVAREKMKDLYHWLGDWRAVAHWWLTGGSDKNKHRNPNMWSASSRKYVNKVFAGMGLSPTAVSSGAYRAPAGTSASGGGGGRTSSQATAARTVTGNAPSSMQTDAGRIPARSAYDIPKGLDGRNYERFYQRFLNAYEAGEESFVDYSSGSPVAYFIPVDLELRAELIGFLDEARISYFAERSKAYAGTATEEVAMSQYSDAIKKAGENQLLILDTNQRMRPWDPLGVNRTQGVQGAAQSINPIASGLKLQQQTEAGLAAMAANAKAAFARGDDEMAYSIIQRALDLAAKNEATLRTYYANAQAQIRAIRSTGAKLPEMVGSDLEKLADGLDFDASDGGVSSGYANSLATLEEISGELEKFIVFDPQTDEPVRRQGATEDDDRFSYKPGVDLYLKPDGTIEHRQSSFTGWTSPGDAQRDEGDYVTVSVKIGNSVKQVKAEWRSSIVGFIEGSNIPVYGKLVTGLMDGKEYAWVENPFAPGKWIRTTTGNPLSIKAPSGFTPYRTGDGLPTFEFSSGNIRGQAGQTYRLEFDQEDGTYHVFEAPGLFGTEWKDLGSASSSVDLADLFKTSGWKVDSSKFSGDDAYFFNSTGAWIGFDRKSYEATIRNTQGPKALPRTPRNAPGFRMAPGNQLPPALKRYEPKGFQLSPGNQQPVSLQQLPRAYADGKVARDDWRKAEVPAVRPTAQRVKPPARDDYRLPTTPPKVAKKKAGPTKTTPKPSSKQHLNEADQRAKAAKRRVKPAPKLKKVTPTTDSQRYGRIGAGGFSQR